MGKSPLVGARKAWNLLSRSIRGLLEIFCFDGGVVSAHSQPSLGTRLAYNSRQLQIKARMNSNVDSFRPLACVVFLGIPDFAQKPVAEQARLRAHLDGVVAIAATPIVEADRIVLDSPEGAAIVVLGDVRAALDAALRARDADESGVLCVGVNRGPVTLAGSASSDSMLIGDGIDVAIIVAGFATAGKMLVSRSFCDALGIAAPTYAANFQRVGIFTDQNLRGHELFSHDSAAGSRRHRRALAYAGLACIGVLALGGAARLAVQSLAASRQPAILVFDIRPQGDIYLDGVMKGRAPAVTRLQVAPGTHAIEVRNGKYPPFVTEVSLNPGEQMDVKHSFIAPLKPKRPGLLEKLKFWQ
jgi:hypothetical protein